MPWVKKLLSRSWVLCGTSQRTVKTVKFDVIAFSKQTLSGTQTKRKLLSVTARFYDPLGLLSPLILPFKCMFQEICQLKVEWDEAPPENLTSRWKELVEDNEGVSSFTIPRCIMDAIEAGRVKCTGLQMQAGLLMAQMCMFR